MSLQYTRLYTIPLVSPTTKLLSDFPRSRLRLVTPPTNVVRSPLYYHQFGPTVVISLTFYWPKIYIRLS